jgi:hypothetical protein
LNLVGDRLVDSRLQSAHELSGGRSIAEGLARVELNRHNFGGEMNSDVAQWRRSS